LLLIVVRLRQLRQMWTVAINDPVSVSLSDTPLCCANMAKRIELLFEVKILEGDFLHRFNAALPDYFLEG